MNDMLKAKIKEDYPNMVVNFEYDGEVQFYRNEKQAAEMDEEKMLCAIWHRGKVMYLNEW